MCIRDRGYSAETTVEEDLVTYEQALALLLAQCDVVAARMRRDGKKCSCVAVTYRTLDFKTRSHQRAFELSLIHIWTMVL